MRRTSSWPQTLKSPLDLSGLPLGVQHAGLVIRREAQSGRAYRDFLALRLSEGT